MAQTLGFLRTGASVASLKICVVADMKRESSETLAGTLMMQFVTVLLAIRPFLC
jgi:hypothetical protein